MELDVNQACTLFLEHSEQITADLVVSRLQTKPQLLFKVSISSMYFIANCLFNIRFNMFDVFLVFRRLVSQRAERW